MGKKNIPDHYVLDKNKKIKKIYHIADIHVRKYERHEEYNSVFSKLYQRINEDSDDSVIVCCGDILHEGISGDAILMVKNFFINLCEICDVVVFKGNHDLSSRSNIEAIDSLTPILMKLETKYNLHVLDMRGLYEYGNLLFGYTTMYDEKVISPSAFKNKTKIALWHGIVHGCTNDDGFSLSNNSKFNQTDFSEYDYTMLGDVHKFQYLNKDKTIAYCGSLVQQNHGESIENHGCIKWDLTKKKSYFMHINNNYGFLTVRIKNNKVSAFNIKALPPNLNLKIIQKNSSDHLVEKVKEEISKKTNIKQFYTEKIDFGYSLEDITLSSSKKKSKSKDSSDSDSDSDSEVDNKNKGKPIGTIKNDEMAINILNTYIDKNYKFSKDEKKEINDTLINMTKNIKYEYSSTEKNIKLKKLWFNNFNVYSDGNFIDYDSLSGIINMCGHNGIGKSSAAVFVLLYAIYGNYDNISKHDYINVKKRHMDTKIILDINGEEYTIEREERVRGKVKIEYGSNVRLYKEEKDISGKSIVEIEKQIIKMVGESDKLISLCIMSQRKCTSFVDLSDNEKKKFLCDILKLDIYNNIGKEGMNQNKVLNTKLGERYKIVYKDHKNKMGDNEKELSKEIKKINDELKELNEDLLEQGEEYELLNRKKIETEIKLDEYKNIDASKEVVDYEKIKKHLIKDKKNHNGDIDDLEEEIEDLNDDKEENDKKLKKYKNIEEKFKKFIKEKNKDIEKIEEEIKKLYMKSGGVGLSDYQESDIKKKEKEMNELSAKDIKLSKDSKKKENNLEKIKNKIINQDFPDDLEKKYGEFKEMDDQMKEINNGLDNLNHKLEKYKNHLDVIKNHKYNSKCKECMENKTTKDKIEIENNIEKLEKEINKLNKDKEKIEKKYIKLEKYNQMMKEKEFIENENNKTGLLVNKENEEIEIVKKEINLIQQKINNITKNINICKETKLLNQEIKEKDNLLKETKEKSYNDYDEYKNLINDNNELEQKISRVELSLEKTKIEVEKIDKKINDLETKMKNEEENNNKVKKYNKLIDENSKIKKKYELLNVDINKKKEKKDTNSTKLIKLECELDGVVKSKNEIKDLENMKSIYDKIVNIINGGFVDKLLTESVIPKFISSVNSILSSFVPFKIKMIHEDNKRIVVYKDDMTNVLKLSGYESLMVNVAFRLAINQVNKRLRTNFFIMDESFSFCDDMGISKVSNLFEYMRELYDWIIVVSHNDQIKTYTDVDLRVEKKDGFSYVSTNKYVKNNIKNDIDESSESEPEEKPKKKVKNIKDKKIKKSLKK